MGKLELAVAGLASLQVAGVGWAIGSDAALQSGLAWGICAVPIILDGVKSFISRRPVADAQSTRITSTAIIANYARSVFLRSGWVAGAAIGAFLASERRLGMPFWLTIIVGYQAMLALQVRSDLQRLTAKDSPPPPGIRTPDP